jgi:hypothetical protein
VSRVPQCGTSEDTHAGAKNTRKRNGPSLQICKRIATIIGSGSDSRSCGGDIGHRSRLSRHLSGADHHYHRVRARIEYRLSLLRDSVRRCVRFGSKADMCAANRHVRFTPDSDRESGFPRKVMSALPPKADIQAGCSVPLVRHAMASSRRSSPQNSSPSTTKVGDPKMFNRLASLVFSS